MNIFPDGPVFKFRPKSIEANNGATITLTCDVVGNPLPDILWIHEPNDKVCFFSGNLSNELRHCKLEAKPKILIK